MADLSFTAGIAGRPADALELVRRAEQFEPRRADLLYREAQVYALNLADFPRMADALRRYRARGGRAGYSLLYYMRLGDDAMVREAAAATTDDYGVTTPIDSVRFYGMKAEALEQLRPLEHGIRIKAVETAYDSIGVDTPADLEEVRRLLAATSTN